MPDDLSAEEAKKQAIQQAKSRYQAIVKSASDFKTSSIQHAIEIERSVVKDAKTAISRAQEQIANGEKGNKGSGGVDVLGIHQSQVTIIENAVNSRKQIEAMAIAIEKATIQRAEQEMKEAIKKAEELHKATISPPGTLKNGAPFKNDAAQPVSETEQNLAVEDNPGDECIETSAVKDSGTPPADEIAEPLVAAESNTDNYSPEDERTYGTPTEMNELCGDIETVLETADTTESQTTESGAVSAAEMFASGRNVKLKIHDGFKKHQVIALERALREWHETKILMTIGSGDNVEYFIQIREPVALEDKLRSLPFINVVSNKNGEITLGVANQ